MKIWQRKLALALVLVFVFTVVAGPVFASPPDEGDLGLSVKPNESSVQITWEPPPYILPEHPLHPELTITNDQVLYYIIERSTSDYPTMFHRLAKIPTNVYSYTDNSVEEGKEYGYCVVASVSENVYGINQITQYSPLITIPQSEVEQQPDTNDSYSSSSSLDWKDSKTGEISTEEQQISPQKNNSNNKDVSLLTVGSTNLFVNDQKIILDVAPKIEDGRTLVPLRVISEALGAEVKYNEENKTITIIKNK